MKSWRGEKQQLPAAPSIPESIPAREAASRQEKVPELWGQAAALLAAGVRVPDGPRAANPRGVQR